MNCKKIINSILPFALLALCAASSFAIDFGGSLKNSTSLKGNGFDSFKLDQLNDLALWLKVPITKSGNVYFIAEGLYEFEYDQRAEKAYNRLDLDLCKFNANLKLGGNPLTVSAGRFIYTDLTGIVYNQNGDGVFAGYENSFLSASFYAAYTGLLNGNLVKILAHPQDSYNLDADMPYDLAQKNFVTAATISLPRLAGSQAVSAQFLGAFKVEGKSHNRMYATLGANGPIYQTLYYDFTTTLGMATFDGGSLDVSNLTKFKLSWFLPFKDLTLNLGGLYASGNAGGISAFWGFTKSTAYNGFSDPQHSGIIKGSFSASIKPINILLVYAGMDMILDAATSSVDYKGFQYNIGADCQIFSDLKVGLGFLQYIDNKNSAEDKVQLSLNALITF